MRKLALSVTALAFVSAMLALGPARALAEDCTGENCSPPASQSSPPAPSEHECEKEKKEEVTS